MPTFIYFINYYALLLSYIRIDFTFIRIGIGYNGNPRGILYHGADGADGDSDYPHITRANWQILSLSRFELGFGDVLYGTNLQLGNWQKISSNMPPKSMP